MIRTVIMLSLLGAALAAPAHAQRESPHQLYQRALSAERSRGNLEEAIALYRQVAASADRDLAARALLRIGEGYLRLGSTEAAAAFEAVVRDFPDRPEAVREARSRLAQLEAPAAVVAQAGPVTLGMRLIWEGQEPDTDIEGGPTPDGRGLTFVDWHTGDLAIRDVASGTARRITNTGYPEYALGSRVSPDGRSVAYFWTPDPWLPQIRVIPIGGGEPRVIYEAEPDAVSFLVPTAWTPDGRGVLAKFYYTDGTAEIAFVDVATGERTVVRQFDDERRPMLSDLSPDGRWIVFDLPSGSGVGERDIHLLAADGSRESVVVRSPANDTHAMFSPDGDHVLFSSDRGGSIDLWAVAVADGAATASPVLMKRDMAENFFWPMGFTKDGSYFYAKDTGGGDIYRVPLGSDGLAAGPAAQLQHSTGYNLAPHLSPDGRRLAYLTMRYAPSVGHTALPVIRDLASGEERVIDALGTNRKSSQLRWAPDGQHLLVYHAWTRGGGDGGERGIFIVNADDGSVRPFRTRTPSDEHSIGNAHWSANGEVVYPRRSRAGEPWEYVVADVSGSSETVVYTGFGTPWSLSPDGAQLAIVRPLGDDAYELAVVPVDGGDARRLATFEGELRPYANMGLEWTPDGRHLVYGLVDTEEGWWASGQPVSLWRVSVATAQAEPMGIQATGLRHISITPDGRGLYYAAGPQVSHEVWVMKGLLDRFATR